MDYLQTIPTTGIRRVRIVVPVRLRPFLKGEHIGKKHLTKSTGKRELAEAEPIAEPIIADFLDILAEAERQSLRDESWRDQGDGLDPEIEYEEEISYNGDGDIVIHKTDRPKPPPPKAKPLGPPGSLLASLETALTPAEARIAALRAKHAADPRARIAQKIAKRRQRTQPERTERRSARVRRKVKIGSMSPIGEPDCVLREAIWSQ
jgi:hypothetical protein